MRRLRYAQFSRLSCRADDSRGLTLLLPNVAFARRRSNEYPPMGLSAIGAPQVLFAMERPHGPRRRGVGTSPFEIRRRNFLKPGQTPTT